MGVGSERREVLEAGGEPKHVSINKSYLNILEYYFLSSIRIARSGAWILTVSTDSPITRPKESRI